MSEKTETNSKVNPGPLGLIGFGMTTVLLNLHNAGIIELSIMIAAMGFALGGAAQIIAGIFEMKNGNTFGGTAFVSFGFFWWSLILIWWNPGGVLNAPDHVAMGFYLLLWAIFTGLMFVGTLTHNRAIQVVFSSLTILFLLLSLGDFTQNETITHIAGWVGIFCGLSAMYASLVQVINNEHGRQVLPL